jgi:hypothetical protein
MIRRALRGLVLTGVVGLVAATASAPASAADTDLGWLRMTPATGTTFDALDTLTQAPCPGGESVIGTITGPGIPDDPRIGYIVGTTFISALPPTESGQLLVPLQLTLRDWFGRNVPGVTPAGTYTITVTCRDSLRGSITYGSFSGQLAIAKDGTYRALGEAAKPFTTTKKTNDPIAELTASAAPAVPATPAPSDAASAPAQSAAPQPTQSAPQPAAGAPSAPSTDEVPVAAATGSSTADSGSSWSWLLVLGGAGLLVVAFLAAGRSRRSPEPVSEQPHDDLVSS